MRSLQLSFGTFILFFMATTFSWSQGSWFTSLEEGLAYAKKESKLIVLEIGILRNRNSTFIGNEIWNDSIVERELFNFTPVTIELDRANPFFEEHPVTITPTIMIVDRYKRVHYESEGQLDAIEISEMLRFMYEDASQIIRLNNTYADGTSLLGKLQLAEENLYLAYRAPTKMKTYFYNRSLVNVAGLEQQFKKEGNTEFGTRARIILLGQEISAGDYETSMAKIVDLRNTDLSVNNRLLAAFYLAIGEYISKDQDQLLTYKEEINSQISSEILARRYSEKLDLLFSPTEK